MKDMTVGRITQLSFNEIPEEKLLSTIEVGYFDDVINAAGEIIGLTAKTSTSTGDEFSVRASVACKDHFTSPWLSGFKARKEAAEFLEGGELAIEHSEEAEK